jgi:CRISPR/Cas system-associated exonuclease Cas4 (RecB family)
MRHKDQGPKVRVLRASELGEYSYCSRAWWYRHVLKIAPPGRESEGRLEAGTRAHNRHGRAVALSSTLRAIGIALALLGLLALALALVVR